MLQREDFYAILSETYKKYSKELFGCKDVLTISNCKLQGQYACYEKLNVISHKWPTFSHIRYALNEYNIRGNALKHALVKCYVLLNLFSGGVMASKAFTTRNPELIKNILIWPCNRSIRFFDFENLKVTSVIKHGYDNGYFNIL